MLPVLSLAAFHCGVLSEFRVLLSHDARDISLRGSAIPTQELPHRRWGVAEQPDPLHLGQLLQRPTPPTRFDSPRRAGYLWGMRKGPLNSAIGQRSPATQYFRLAERRLHDRLEAIHIDVRLTRTEVHEIALTLDPLVDHLAFTEWAIHEIEGRVCQIERARKTPKARSNRS